MTCNWNRRGIEEQTDNTNTWGLAVLAAAVSPLASSSSDSYLCYIFPPRLLTIWYQTQALWIPAASVRGVPVPQLQQWSTPTPATVRCSRKCA
jgi:hypothetical protein